VGEPFVAGVQVLDLAELPDGDGRVQGG